VLIACLPACLSSYLRACVAIPLDHHKCKEW
jgi:hypothetical protein